MILISFAFLGKDVKIEVQGTTPINQAVTGEKIFEELRTEHESILKKEGNEFKRFYDWCKNNHTGMAETGRYVNFAF